MRGEWWARGRSGRGETLTRSEVQVPRTHAPRATVRACEAADEPDGTRGAEHRVVSV